MDPQVLCEFPLAEGLSPSALVTFPGLHIADTGPGTIRFGPIRDRSEPYGFLGRFDSVVAVLRSHHRPDGCVWVRSQIGQGAPVVSGEAVRCSVCGHVNGGPRHSPQRHASTFPAHRRGVSCPAGSNPHLDVRRGGGDHAGHLHASDRRRRAPPGAYLERNGEPHDGAQTRAAALRVSRPSRPGGSPSATTRPGPCCARPCG